MKQIDYSQGKTLKNILQTTLPMLVAQVLNLLYNIVDRIYIARISGVGSTALAAVGLCFPIIILISAFTYLYSGGGSPLFAIARGRMDRKRASDIQNTVFMLLVLTAVVLMVTGELFGASVLRLFGAEESMLKYALPYLRIYLLGTAFSMISAGMNPFITAQGYPAVAMTTVVIGAVANLILDPIFIFALGMGIRGAAIATVISQAFSACFVIRFIFGAKIDQRVMVLSFNKLRSCLSIIRDILGLGLASFVMLFTNSLVQVSCNKVLMDTGGSMCVSAMTIINSARQMFETPISAISEGASPIISFNYGASEPKKLREAATVMFLLGFSYSAILWLLILWKPEGIIRIFSSDKQIMDYTVHAFRIYFAAFVFMTFQFGGQSVFKALGKKRHAVFFSIFRKIIIVVPLTFLLPYTFGLGMDGVFLAEPISNIIGGLACFVTMIFTVRSEFRHMAKNKL